MEYIKTSEYHTRIDVYFDGEKYVFINAFHGLVAIARRDNGFPDFSSDGMTAYNSFHVEKTKTTISAPTIERVIRKSESKYMPAVCKFIYNEKDKEFLPYAVRVKLPNCRAAPSVSVKAHTGFKPRHGANHQPKLTRIWK